MKETIQRLQLLADRAKKYYWKDESEVVVKLSDVRAVLEFYERHKSESELKPFCVTPEWDKIPGKFEWVAVDEDGDECAYTTKPSCVDDVMWGNAEYAFTGRKLNMANIDWTKTLSKRPAK